MGIFTFKQTLLYYKPLKLILLLIYLSLAYLIFQSISFLFGSLPVFPPYGISYFTQRISSCPMVSVVNVCLQGRD